MEVDTILQKEGLNMVIHHKGREIKVGKLSVHSNLLKDVAENPETAAAVIDAIQRYKHKDWGLLGKEDREVNRQGLEYGSRILGAYDTPTGKIYIITDAATRAGERTATTVKYTRD